MKENKKQTIKKIIIAILSLLGVVLLTWGVINTYCVTNGTQENTQEIQEKQVNKLNNIDTESDTLLVNEYKYDEIKMQTYNFDLGVTEYDGYYNQLNLLNQLIEISQTNKNGKALFHLHWYTYIEDTRTPQESFYSVIDIFSDDNYIYFVIVNNTYKSIKLNGNDSLVTNEEGVTYTSVSWSVAPLQPLIFTEDFFILCKDMSIWIDGVWNYYLNYYITKYIILPRNVKDYTYYCGFRVNGYPNNVYHAIKIKNGNMTFLGREFNNGTYTDIETNIPKSISADGLNYVYKILPHIDGNLTAEQILNYTQITYTSFTTQSLNFVNEHFIKSWSPNFNGAYYINSESILFTTLEYRNINEYNIQSWTIEGVFKIDNLYFTKARFKIESSPSNNTYLVNVNLTDGYGYNNFEVFRGYLVDGAFSQDGLIDNTNKVLYIEESNYNANMAFWLNNILSVESNYIYGASSDGYIGNVFVLIGSSFSSIASILAIQLLPGLSIGMLIFVPFIISIVLFVVWLFKR